MAEANDTFMGMNKKEEDFVKGVIAKVAISAATYPIQCVKTLIQLGHEPFPLSSGRLFVVAGRNAYFLPNAFSYGKQLATQHGFSILYTGLDSACVALLVNCFASNSIENYINKHYPEIGGAEVSKDVEEKDMTDHESFRVHLRNAVRASFVRVGATVVSRPFTVIAVRQVAQLIGKECKYTNVFSSLKLIGVEEGPGGLFSGLIPQLIGDLIVVWGVHSLGYLGTRALKHSGLYDKQDDENSKKEAQEIQKFLNFAVPFIVNSWSYPYTVVSNVMAVAGSGLAVSFLPYSPSFDTWQSAYDYLCPNNLKRGARLFLREQVGAVAVGVDQQLYASNKHFV